MYKLRLFLCLIVFGLSLFHSAKSNGNQTCEIAKSFAKSPPNDKVRVHCEADKSCAGFHCRGVYLVDNAKLHIKKGDPVCFGAIINHCDTPLSMDVYFDSALMNSTLQNRLHHNTTMQIPGITLTTNNIKADFFIFVEMTHKDHKVTVALTAKVRFLIGKIVNWPEALNFKVIPEQTFPVPPCAPGEFRNVTPIPEFPTCVPPVIMTPIPVKPFSSSASVEPVSTSAPVVPLSKTYGKPCDPTNVYQCSHNERCTYNKTCVCLTGMVLNPISRYCDKPGASPGHKLNPVGTTTLKSTSSDSLGVPASQTGDDSKKTNTGLITGLAVGAVAVLGIVILISFFIWRSRSVPSDHMPIVENEEVII